MHRVHSATLFPTEQPLAREQMIGRETDIEELVTQLANGVHRIIAAPRRTGKSSVCQAVVATLRDCGFYTVSVSLFQLTDGPALARGLVAETLANRDGLHKLVQRARGTTGFILRGAGLALMLEGQERAGRCRRDGVRPYGDIEARCRRSDRLGTHVASGDRRARRAPAHPVHR